MKLPIALLCFLFFLHSNSQTSVFQEKDLLRSEKPKLVIGIVVDQMRYDYLNRYHTSYGEGGFKRIINEGFSFKNTHFNYIPTYTGPGHASVYTGTIPAVHGIIANDWYNKFKKEMVYCVADETFHSVGTENKAGKMSPKKMITTTITDELRLATQMRSKVIGISLKDRGAILPAGHSANAAYWYHGKNEGKWITSSYYMQELPEWVMNFNESSLIESYLNLTWDTLYAIESYTQSGPDDSPYEKGFKGKEKPVFPYDLQVLAPENGNYDILRETPYGNSITTDFAIAAIEGESLGQGSDTDFLAISYSSPDYIGHNFGINSVEIQDNYLRLDKDLERLFVYLDGKLGKGEYTVFLTADHGAVHVPAYLNSVNIPGGYFEENEMVKEVEGHLLKTYKISGLVENVSANQFFLNYEVLAKNNLKSVDVQNTIAHFVLQYPKVDKVFTRAQLQNAHYENKPGTLVQNGFHQKRSGEVVYVLEPGVISTWYVNGGTTHGSGYTYDTHIPLMFFGKGINKGSTYQRAEITDIAPTLSAFLGIALPNGATGRVLYEMLD